MIRKRDQLGRCAQCEHYHSLLSSCDEGRMTREHICASCNPGDRLEPKINLERVPWHPREIIKHISREFGIRKATVYRCPECAAIWLHDYRRKNRTRADEAWFIIELPKEEADAS